MRVESVTRVVQGRSGPGLEKKKKKNVSMRHDASASDAAAHLARCTHARAFSSDARTCGRSRPVRQRETRVGRAANRTIAQRRKSTAVDGGASENARQLRRALAKRDGGKGTTRHANAMNGARARNDCESAARHEHRRTQQTVKGALKSTKKRRASHSRVLPRPQT